MLAPALSRCRWVSFRDRLLLLVRDRLLGSVEFIEGTGCWGLIILGGGLLEGTRGTRDRLLQAGPPAAWGGNGIVGYGLERLSLWFKLWS